MTTINWVNRGMLSAFLSAILCGASPVACKAILGEISFSLLAGLLYLGSGLGLTGIVIRQVTTVYEVLSDLTRPQWFYLVGTILSGGVAAPLFFTYGIRSGTAIEVSLLFNFETVATTLFAWLIFQEHIGLRVWIGNILIIGASILVILTGSGELQLSIPGLSVLAACLFWGIDNNLTRELESIPAYLLACIKGWSAGVFNVILFLVFFRSSVTASQISGALAIGALSYGVSFVLFINALRSIGAARTSSWLASGPFIGAILSVIILGERPPGEYWVAELIILSGMVLLYGEDHRHLHQHECIAHAHPHVHDEHHLHQHKNEETDEKHDNYHVHEPIIHNHRHWPDIHHRHKH